MFQDCSTKWYIEVTLYKFFCSCTPLELLFALLLLVFLSPTSGGRNSYACALFSWFYLAASCLLCMQHCTSAERLLFIKEERGKLAYISSATILPRFERTLKNCVSAHKRSSIFLGHLKILIFFFVRSKQYYSLSSFIALLVRAFCIFNNAWLTWFVKPIKNLELSSSWPSVRKVASAGYRKFCGKLEISEKQPNDEFYAKWHTFNEMCCGIHCTAAITSMILHRGIEFSFLILFETACIM